ncbi:MAG: hypothetical protein IJY92_06870 [Alphaproteobacteria bacterium]|nr:hypothetical protein [Alphaproteobacteria bacterium]
MTDDLDINSKIQKLKYRINWMKKGLSIAEKFVQNKSSELEKIDEEIELNTSTDIEHDARKLSLDPEQSEALLKAIEKELDGLSDSLLNVDEEDDEDGENDKIKNLRRYRRWLKRGLNFVGVFIQEKTLELKDIEQQLEQLEISFLDPSERKAKAVLPAEMLSNTGAQEMTIGIGYRGQARRGALTKKEKEELVEVAEKKKKAEREGASAQPGQQPGKPRPGDKVQQPWKLMTPAEKKAFITKKLKEKDPRQQKEAIDLLKKPENKPFLDEFMKDKEFEKTYKNAETMVGKYDKIRTSIRKNLKTLMRSSSDVVKAQVSLLRAGKVGSAVAGLKEISSSVKFDNDVGMAAKGVVKGVEDLYKMFNIKPEEALNKEMLEEARPVFTHQMAEKGRNDREIDLKSRQNKVWGESRELTDEERAALKRIAQSTGSDKLPSESKKEDMKLVKDLLVDTVKSAKAKTIVPPIIAKGMEK